MHPILTALVLALVLAGCAETTGVPLAGGAVADQPPSTEHLAIARAAGLNPPSAVAGAARAEGGAARDVALAGAMAVNPIGMSHAAGLGLGIVSILAAPPEGPEAWDTTLVRLPAGASPEPFAARMEQVIRDTTGPAQLKVILTPMGRIGSDTMYVMRLEQHGGTRFFKANPLNNVEAHKALSRAFPGRVYAYLASRRVAGGWTPAAIFDAGRTYPL